MCCCSPYTAALTAGLLSIFQSILGLAWNIQLLAVMHNNSTMEAVDLLVDVKSLNNYPMIYGMTMCSIVIMLLWFISACMLLKGNAVSRTELMSPWCILNNVVIIAEGLMGVYFFIEYSKVSWRFHHHPSSIKEIKMLTYLRLSALFSGGFYLCPIVNFILSVLVFRRFREVQNQNYGESRALRDEERHMANYSNADFPSNAPPPYTPQSVVESGYQNVRNTSIVDPAPVEGWSQRPLLEEEVHHVPSMVTN